MAGFDHYQGSGDFIRSVATVEGSDDFPAQEYYVYAPGTYLDPSHQIFDPYLYYPLPTAFYADTTAMPAAVPMRVPQTLLSAVENWVPNYLGLEACREITMHGIGHHLWSLELHNYANSPQRWSEFPDADPGDAETLDRYQTAGADFHHLLSGDSLLQCERCGTLCDLDLKIAIQKKLQYALLTNRVTKLEEDVFGVEDKLKDPATREIFNAYRGFRVFWHLLLLACHIDPHRFDQNGHTHINEIPLWGDLMTDITLLGKGSILEQHINFVYGISARAADYLYRWQSEWQREILWLDTYAGVFRHKVSERAPFRDYAAIKIGCTLEYLVEAEQRLDGSYKNLQVFKETKIQVRALFRELHISLMHPAIDLPLME
ncbi:hypothetical protein E4U17_005669 [Claviceps sp. LM77 group G4]|nr:hypothetical protein E4U17_005669 [Claviceps sp. LM77 group G4]KAG6082635.1 hypothetical protein E4U33_005507 [Claviceps sp. LM78 group G4]